MVIRMKKLIIGFIVALVLWVCAFLLTEFITKAIDTPLPKGVTLLFGIGFLTLSACGIIIFSTGLVKETLPEFILVNWFEFVAILVLFIVVAWLLLK